MILLGILYITRSIGTAPIETSVPNSEVPIIIALTSMPLMLPKVPMSRVTMYGIAKAATPVRPV